MQTQDTAQSLSFPSAIWRAIQNFFNPATALGRRERDKHLKDIALFAASTLALIALHKQISKLITLEPQANISSPAHKK